MNINSGTGNVNFTVDGTGSSGKVQIGNSGTATPDLLVLDNGTADPTGVNGGMYYNTTSNRFRCYQENGWNDCVTASSSASLKFKYKTANQTNSTTTLANDTDLKFNIGANETWSFRFSLSLNSPAPADTKWNISTPAGVTNCKYAVTVYRTNTNTTSNVSCGTPATGISTTGNDEVIEVMGSIENGSTAGTVQLQWAENTASGTMTVYRDSYMISGISTGADLAEMYSTNDMSIEPGDVVSLDPNLQVGMQKSTSPYDQSVLGVISTKPGLVLGYYGTEGTKTEPVALSGRIPVKVSSQNGKISPGDYLTTSSIPGVAMKATKAGAIIGTAMTSFDGEGVGKILVFVKNGSSTGSGFDNENNSVDILANLLSEPNNKTNYPLSTVNELIDASNSAQPQKTKSTVEANLISYITKIVSDLFKNPVEFLGRVVFHSDVTFGGRPFFNKDTAGHAVIKTGETEVVINFEKEYSQNPVITANYNLVGSIKADEVPPYAVYDVSTKGFKIRLSRAAGSDLGFAWVALAVSDDAVSTSNQSLPTPIPTTTIVSETPTPIPSVIPSITPAEVASPSATPTIQITQ